MMIRIIAIFFAFIFAETTNAQSPISTTESPVNSIHVVPSGAIIFDSSEKAKDIVNEILLTMMGVNSTQWVILVVEGDPAVPNAASSFWPSAPPDKKRRITFNKTFMNQISSAGGKWPAYCVAAHEIGHLVRFHVQNKQVNRPGFLREVELEADYYCGFVLGKMGSTYEQATSAIWWTPPVVGYPTRAERLTQVGRGWIEATQIYASQVLLSSGLENPQPDSNNSINVFDRFDIKENLDIYGNDIAFITDPGGQRKTGIPGISAPECALRCYRDPTCKAFSFDKWNNWCFLKGEIKTAVLDARSTLGVKKPISFPATSTATPLPQKLVDKRFHDTPFDNRTTTDWNECKNACFANNSCVAFSFLKPPIVVSNCQMFSQSIGYYHESTADSGYKEQPTN